MNHEDEIVVDLTDERIDAESDIEQVITSLLYFWQAKLGSYQSTSSGTHGRTFKEINEGHARAKVNYYSRLLSWLEEGNYLRRETKDRIYDEWRKKGLDR